VRRQDSKSQCFWGRRSKQKVNKKIYEKLHLDLQMKKW
jgi:hypothetical protein